MHSGAVYGPRTKPRDIAMPDFIRVLGQFDSIELLLAVAVEQTQFDFRGVRGKK
jgi:hypothetical protein